jgi:succinate dehydrogenase hydrophobic anchor subunit
MAVPYDVLAIKLLGAAGELGVLWRIAFGSIFIEVYVDRNVRKLDIERLRVPVVTVVTGLTIAAILAHAWCIGRVISETASVTCMTVECSFFAHLHDA